MSVGLARLGEATVGEAMPVDAGETGVGRSRAESEAEGGPRRDREEGGV